jgi:hypothetical protein
MSFLKKHHLTRPRRLLWALCAVVVLLGTTTIAYARYQQGAERQMKLKLADNGAQVCLVRDQWTQVGNQYQLKFTLTNGTEESCAAEDQQVYVQVFSTAATADSKLTLWVDGYALVGTPVAVTEGSVFEQKFGPGQVYYFYTEAGEEVSWALAGGRLSQVAMELTVENGAAGTVYTVMTAAAGTGGGA